MDVLLVGPAGPNLVLLSDAGSAAGPTFGANNVTVTSTVTGSGTTYEVKVAMPPTATSGTVITTIPAGRAVDAAGNANTASSGGDNVVNWVLDTTKATCAYNIVTSPAPAHINFTVQDVGSGIASIAFPTLNNIVSPVPVPPFDLGTTSPVSFTATKADNTKRAQIAVVTTDVAGNQSSCV